MADIRINSLPTTATSSASDDYIAIDGSANGTRKLSVYSPTFGGNLTVSGSGGATINYSTALSLLTMGDAAVGSYSRLVMRTGPSKTAWAIGAQDIVDNALTFTASTAAGGTTFTTPLMTLTGGGNLLLGTTTDGGDKLQVAGTVTSTSAGFRSTGTSNGFVAWLDSTPSKASRFIINSSGDTVIGVYNGSSWSEPLSIANATGNATFAGKIITSSAIGASNSDSLTTTIQAGNSSGVKSNILLRDSWNGSNNNNAYFAVQLGDGSTTSDALRIDYQKSATFAGTVSTPKSLSATNGGSNPSSSTELAQLVTNSSSPRLVLVRTSSTANQKIFEILNNDDGITEARYVNDAYSAGYTVMKWAKNGRISMPNLPTSSAGLVAGDLWVDTTAGNVIKRV